MEEINQTASRETTKATTTPITANTEPDNTYETTDSPLSPNKNKGATTPAASAGTDSTMQDVSQTLSTIAPEGNSFKRPLIGPIRKPTGLSTVDIYVKAISPDNTNISKTYSVTVTDNDNVVTSSPDHNTIIDDEDTPSQTSFDSPSDSKDASKDHCVSGDTQDPVTGPTGSENTSENVSNVKKKHSAKLSPAEQASQNQVPLPYLEPKWGGSAEDTYSFEVIKNGKVMDSISLNEKSFYVFGRLAQCDVTMEHPSLSRYHAVVQYRQEGDERHEAGWYLYDLESTHGTFINKNLTKPRVYYRIKVGHVLKFGGSTRLHILQGPAEDAEEESELTVTELKKEKEFKKKEAELSEMLEEEGEEEDKSMEKSGDAVCSWGMGEDATEPEPEINFADALPANEDLYIEDPKKALKGYFEREGYDLPEYQFEDVGHGKNKCIVEVPVESPSGQPVYAEAVVSGKRKDAVVACALEACKILDRYGLLRKKDQGARKAKTRDWEANDYYGSDDDEFLDRTGEVQKKRERRMKRAGKVTKTTETYQSLSEKLSNVIEEMESVNSRLESARKASQATAGEGLDALDAYMTSIKKGAMDTKTKMALKCRHVELKKERAQLERLVNIAKPAAISASTSSDAKSNIGPIGALTRKICKTKIYKPASLPGKVHAPVPRVRLEKEEEAIIMDKAGAAKEQSTRNEDIEGTDKEGNIAGGLDTISDITSAEAMQNESVTHKTSSTGGEAKPGHKAPPPESKSNHTTKKTLKRPTSSTEQAIKRLRVEGGVNLMEKIADFDPDYADWVPPSGQTGDGKTHLNERFGY